MEICEAKVVSRTEEQALGLGLLLLTSPSHPPPYSSSSSAPTAAAPVEPLTVEFGDLGLGTKLEEKSEGDGMTGKDIEWDATGWNIEPSGWGDEEDDAPERDFPVPSDVGKSEPLHYPQRPGQPDCVFYRRAGGCRFGMNCKFNHPPKRKRNRGRSKKPSEATLEGKIATCEVNLVLNEELGLTSSSCSASSSAAAAEALVSEFKNMILEEKSDMKPDRNHDRSCPRSGETSNLKKDSISTKEGKDNGLCFPLRPAKPDCSYYLKTGNCQFGSNCRFNHPPTRKENMVRSKQSEPTQATKGKEKKNTPERVGKTESKKVVKERQNQAHSEKVEHKDREKDFKEKKKETPSGKVGKTEHKADKQKLEQTLSGMMGPAEVEAAEEKVTSMERDEKGECKDYSMQEGFKFVEACEHDHVQEKAELGPVQLNFLGLPIRPGEIECPYYMRTGGCKFASNCRYHHPDPTAVVGQDPHSGYHPGRSEHAPGGSALPMAPWPFPINSSEPVPFFGMGPSYTPGFFPLPHQGFYQNPEWNGYQVPVSPWFSPEMNMVNIPVSTVHMPDVTVHQQVNINEYPERPGQPECHFFMKNGECKFKSACRFHHPKSRLQQCA